MAIVGSAQVFQESLSRIQRHDYSAVPTLMGSRGEVEEEASRVAEEDKFYVAVGKDLKEGKSNLLWALNHSARKKKIFLMHVHQPSELIPFMGGKFPAHKLEEHHVRAHRDLEKKKMQKMLNDYLFICAQLGIRAEKLYIEMKYIEEGIVELIAQHGIKRLIMGAAADKHKKIKSKKAIFVSQHAHISCHVWFVCKGYLIQTREGSLDGTEIGISESRLVSTITEVSQVKHIRSRSEVQIDHVRLTNPVQEFIRRVKSQGRPVATVASLEGTRGGSMRQGSLAAEESEWEGSSRGTRSQNSGLLPWSSSEEVVSSLESLSLIQDGESEDGSLLSSIHESEEEIRLSSPINERGERRFDSEMIERLQEGITEIENTKREALDEFFKRRKAEKDAIEAIRRAKESEVLYANEVKQRKEMEALLAKETLELNRVKSQRDEVLEELRTTLDQKMALESQVADSDQMLQELQEKIVTAVELLVTFKQERDRLQLERDDAVKEAEQLRRRGEEEATTSQRQQYFSEFSFSEIDAATRNFDPCLVIGEGGYGSVYKGFLRNTDVAIKLLNSSSSQGRSEFQQEVDVLSRMRHPNLITLVGTCPEAWALIYEYLPNGSLEDRLACKDNTLPLSWQTRICIAVEICSVLIFLHHNKPHGVIHGDLKPANILMDANMVGKLGDFGICRSFAGDENSSNTSTSCWITENPKGTLVYMDPEFLMTGELTPKSDVYSFGIVLLQLLTAKSAVGIAKEVQSALDEGRLSDLLDSSAGNWPFVQAKQLAHLALRCCEINRNNRPDLMSDVWRVLEELKAASGASLSPSSLGSEDQVPSYFICPIFLGIMHDPYVAADGFTYEAEAIKGWLDNGHDTSPMTNLKLAHLDLIPNYALRSAIEEWRQQR